MNTAINGIASLPQLGVIRVQGEDAVKFLQGQLTQDFALLAPSQARLAAYCSAKGRMLASFVAFNRAGEDILLICSRDILSATLKRLSMFVLRAKVRLTDASAECHLLGLAGESMDAIAGVAQPPWSRVDLGSATIVELYRADGARRGLWVAPVGAQPPPGPAMAPQMWDWLEVRSGIARITQPVVDAFVPQMLNYESVGGVNFKKGCYPGQEVVARSQFRGTLKRRAYIAHSEALLEAGQEVFPGGGSDQPCGIVAQAATSPDGGSDAIVSLQTAAAEAGTLTIPGSGGQLLQLQQLPYLLLADV